MMPSTWQWAGNGTPFADTAPDGLNCTEVIWVGVTGKFFRFARLTQAAAGSEAAVAAKPGGAPRTARDITSGMLRLEMVIPRCRRRGGRVMLFFPKICSRGSLAMDRR